MKWQIHRGLTVITQLYSSAELRGAADSIRVFQIHSFCFLFLFTLTSSFGNPIPIIPTYFMELVLWKKKKKENLVYSKCRLILAHLPFLTITLYFHGIHFSVKDLVRSAMTF